MMVILVYGKGQEPATLILHGNDGLTWLSITDEPYGRPDTGVSRAIKQALEDKVSN